MYVDSETTVLSSCGDSRRFRVFDKSRTVSLKRHGASRILHSAISIKPLIRFVFHLVSLREVRLYLVIISTSIMYNISGLGNNPEVDPSSRI